MIAKYPGTCKICGSRIDEGVEIEWAAGEGASHARCAQLQRDREPAPSSALLDQIFARQRAEHLAWLAAGPAEPAPELGIDCAQHGRWYSPDGTCPMCRILATARQGLDIPAPKA